jgi:sialic acid synthase SpsE
MTKQKGRCYIIAEAGSNHDGKLPQALDLIDVAAIAGADAVKFQLFQAKKLYAKKAGTSDYLKNERSIFDIIRDAELPLAWLPILQEHCKARGVDFMASAFDEESVDRLDPFVSAHKCASYEMTHAPLLRHLALKQKPLIVSTGAAKLSEVAQALQVIEAAHNFQITLLQCTASYPTPLKQANVQAMLTMSQRFGYPVGLSDHTREPSIAPCAAVALGASIIEKHFTLSNSLPGPDHRFALEPNELTQMIADIRATEDAMGDGEKEPLDVELELRGFARRSIFTARSVREGQPLVADDLIILRNGKLAPGLPPELYSSLLGKRTRRAMEEQQPITYNDLQE